MSEAIRINFPMDEKQTDYIYHVNRQAHLEKEMADKTENKLRALFLTGQDYTCTFLTQVLKEGMFDSPQRKQTTQRGWQRAVKRLYSGRQGLIIKNNVVTIRRLNGDETLDDRGKIKTTTPKVDETTTPKVDENVQTIENLKTTIAKTDETIEAQADEIKGLEVRIHQDADEIADLEDKLADALSKIERLEKEVVATVEVYQTVVRAIKDTKTTRKQLIAMVN